MTGAPEAFDTFVENLRTACATAPERRITIESLNRHDMPDYWLSVWRRWRAQVGLVQIAGFAARGAPDSAAPGDAALLAGLRDAGDVWLAAEFIGRPDDDAAWLEAARRLQSGAG